jgi:hypothetical protein
MSHFAIETRSASVACLPHCDNDSHIGGFTGEDPFAECHVVLHAGVVTGPHGERVSVIVNVFRDREGVTAEVEVIPLAANDRPCAGAELGTGGARELAALLIKATELVEGAADLAAVA